MELLFTIVDAPSDAHMQGQSKTFADSGEITLGRAADNTWVLPDSERIVSSYHASISFQNGSFVLTDNSTNGTFLNDNPVPLGAGNCAPLKNGDTVTMGRYLLRATLVQAAPKLPEGLGAVDFLDQSPQVTPPSTPVPDFNDQGDRPEARPQSDEFDKWLDPQAQRPPDPWTSIELNSASLEGEIAETDPLAVLDKYENISSANNLWSELGPEEDPDWWRTSYSNHAPAISHAVNPLHLRQERPPWTPPSDQPAAARQGPQENSPGAPANTGQPLAGHRAPPAETPSTEQNTAPDAHSSAAARPEGASETTAPAGNTTTRPLRSANDQLPAAATAGSTGSMAQQNHTLAQELGLDRLTTQQEAALLPETAAIIRESITSLMNLLSARATIKNELRVDRTMIKPTENNPLKFSPNAQEALAAMFTSGSAAFLTPSAAVKEGFEDISDHQVAVLVGMKMAFDTMLSHFDPSRLERKLNKNDNRALLTSKKARLWENYTAHFQTLKKDREATYRELFGNAFAEAYEKQLVKLKGTRKPK